jgi:hypothetical protein
VVVGYTTVVYVNGLDWFGVMVFTASFNDILVISYWSVLLVEETEVPEENQGTAAIH